MLLRVRLIPILFVEIVYNLNNSFRVNNFNENIIHIFMYLNIFK